MWDIFMWLLNGWAVDLQLLSVIFTATWQKTFLTRVGICSHRLFLSLERSKGLCITERLNRNSSTVPFSYCVMEVRGNIQSGCFLILSVTDSPAICRRWMASLSGFPFRLTPLMARTLSPMWMAPVLQGKKSTDRNTSLYWTVQRGMLGNLWVCQRAVWDGHKDTSCYIKGETAIVQRLVYWRKTVSKLGATDSDPRAASFIVEIFSPVFSLTPLIATPPSTHLSARPFLVRPEITMGSKGSSVPEMVMPRGPLYRFSSTV